jgi:pseudouridine synthase
LTRETRKYGKKPPKTNTSRSSIDNAPVRINRILSMAGVASRRRADEMISEGRVAVNGLIVTEPGTKAFWGRDSITVDGLVIPGLPEKIYLMLNKPFGYICSLSDPEGRPLVTDLITGIKERIYPVGRLDFNSLGLLLLTNDGEWTKRLTHPSYGLRRTYKATVSGMISQEAIRLLEKGVILEDGPSGPAKVTLINRNERQSILRLTISQGRNRQIRRMIEAVGYDVIHLVRIGFGPLTLGDLKLGQFRPLTEEEVSAMNQLVGLA